MSEVFGLHRLALRLEQECGIGNDNISAKVINAIVQNDPTIKEFNTGVYLESLKDSGMVVKTSESKTAVDYDKYSLLPDWDAEVSRAEVKESIINRTPDSEAEQSGFAEFAQ